MKIDYSKYPHYLQSYGDMLSYFQSHFEDMLSTEKGRKFVEFALRTIPHSNIGSDFDIPQQSRKESHDKGVDATAVSKSDNKNQLCIQIKYSLKGVDEFDSIISKFANYDSLITSKDTQTMLFSDDNSRTYMIFTVQDLKQITQNYEISNRSSKNFYLKLKFERRIHVIDGQEVFKILQTVYRKLNILPSNLELTSEKGFINYDNVYIGVVSAKMLKSLYDEYGDALFFENIREYLGIEKKETVNKDIVESLGTNPKSFLSLNNGITFRAGQIEFLSSTTLKLDDASIVNGCQTTMSIVNFLKNKPQPEIESYVLVKVVQTENSWEVAKSANFQNEINKIDLDLAQFITPQKVRVVADATGIRLEHKQESPFALLDSIYKQRVTYDAIRTLFTGIFSKNPINIFTIVHSEVNKEVLDDFFNDSNKDKVYQILFEVAQAMNESSMKIAQSLEKANEKEIKELFGRFLKPDGARYRAFLSILALCGAMGKNIYEKPEHLTYHAILNFLCDVESLITSDMEKFKKYYFNAFKTVVVDVMNKNKNSSKDKIIVLMYKDLQYAKFDNLYKNLRLQGLVIE